MPIKATCRCGQSFAAKDELAGRTVKCPKCGQGLVVPAPTSAPSQSPTSSIADLLDEAGVATQSGPRCPRCENPILPNAVLCTKCGLNLQTGMAVASSVRANKAVGHGEAAESVMERAKAEIAKAPPPKDESAGGMIFNYIMAAALLLIALVTIGIAYLGFTKIESSGNSQFYAGIVMAVLGWLMYTSSHITLIVLNFKDGPVHGILSIVIPFYAMIYGALRNHGFWALLWNLGLLFGLLGFFMIFWFKDAKSNDVRRPSTVDAPWASVAAADARHPSQPLPCDARRSTADRRSPERQRSTLAWT